MAKPGWYPDAQDPSLLQLWDGHRWTGQRKPRADPLPPPTGPAVIPLDDGESLSSTERRIVLAGFFVGLVFAPLYLIDGVLSFAAFAGLSAPDPVSVFIWDTFFGGARLAIVATGSVIGALIAFVAGSAVYIAGPARRQFTRGQIRVAISEIILLIFGFLLALPDILRGLSRFVGSD